MTITNRDYEGRTVFFCTEEKEWKDLTSKGHVAYRADEINLIQQYPCFDAALKMFLFRAKLLIPTSRVYAVRAS